MSSPLISVIIAVYNTDQYISQAVDSVLAQSWENIELIIVNDGSTDNTQKELDKYLGDERVRVLSTCNNGQPKAKNIGIKNSRGQFIGFCDADDFWLPRKLEQQMSAFVNPLIGVVYSDVFHIDEAGNDIYIEKTQTCKSGKITDSLIIKNYIPFGTALVRRECFETSGLFDESLPMGIDWDLWLRYSMDWEFYYLPEKTYVYRVWGGQMSSNFRGRYEYALRILKKFIETYPNAVPPSVQNRAWSDMYVSRGMSVASSDKSFFEPLKDLLAGLRHDWTYKSAWKSMAKLLLRRV